MNDTLLGVKIDCTDRVYLSGKDVILLDFNEVVAYFEREFGRQHNGDGDGEPVGIIDTSLGKPERS